MRVGTRGGDEPAQSGVLELILNVAPSEDAATLIRHSGETPNPFILVACDVIAGSALTINRNAGSG